MLTAEIADALHGLADPGGCFGVDDGQNFGPMGGYCVLEFGQAEGFPPGLLDRHDIGPVATGHVGQTQAEVALDGHQNGVSRLNRVGQARFHGRTAGAAHWNGEAVVGLPGVAEQLLHLTHQLDVEGVEVPNRHSGQGLKHGGMGVRGARTEQQTIRRGYGSQRAAMG